MSGRARRLLSLLATLVLSSPASAQYLFLDANGDSVYTEADVVPDSGEVVADIWLVTDACRDGRPAVCVTGSVPLMMSSYVVNLRATDGTVNWGAFTNHVAGFSALPGGSDSLEFQGGAAGMPISAGRYRLATIHFHVASGAPSVAFVRESKFLTGTTSFGSSCDGLDFDSTLKLGSDWFDADGLDHVSPNQAPALAPVQDVVMDENTTASRHVVASDPDGDDLSLRFEGVPGYATTSIPVQTPGRVEADVTFAPNYNTSGFYSLFPLVSAVVSDGEHTRQTSFRVTVRNVNRPPVILPIADATMEIGTTLQVHVYASDPDWDEQPTLALAGGPPFATFAAGVIDFHPGLYDAGAYTVQVSASDPFDTAIRSFGLTVTDSGTHRAPEFDPITDVWMDEGDHQFVTVRAHTSNEDLVSIRLAQAPPYVGLTPTDQMGEGSAYVAFSPGPRDSGVATVRLVASTPLYRTTSEFRVHVGNKVFAPEFTSWVDCVEPGSRAFAQFQVYSPDLDSTRVSFGALPSWARVSYVHVGHLNGESEPGLTALSLFPDPEERPASVGITVYLNRGTPEEEKWAVTLAVSPYDECILGGCFDPCTPPIPDADGPYAAVAGAPVLLHATSNPGVADSSYRWTFGDGHAALGADVVHTYAEGGRYRAIVRTSNYLLSRDSVDVVIADSYPARVLAEGEASTVPVTHDADLCVELEPQDQAYRFSDLDRSSLWLWIPRGGNADSIPAVRSEWIAGGTTGSDRLHICFSHRDLGRWFLGIRENATVQGRVQGRLASGARVRAPIMLELVGHGWDPGRVVARPNPMNPVGTLSFENRRAGRVSVRIYDASGRLVRTLWDAPLDVGPVDLPFDGRGTRGQALRGGIYYYQIESAEHVRTGRMAIVK